LIALSETMYFPDTVMVSSIGNSYGDIYEAQLEWAQASSINSLDKNGVPPYFESYIKPFLHEDPKL